MRDATATSLRRSRISRPVALGARLQRGVDRAAVLHAGEIGRPLLQRDFVLQPMNALVFVLDVLDDRVAIPQHLEAELHLVAHLRQHVAEGIVRRAQQLDDVVLRLENRAERHRDDGVIAHDDLVHPLVRQHVLARRVEDAERDVGDDGGEIAVVNGVNLRAVVADAGRAELQRRRPTG